MLKEWQFNILFLVGVGGAIILLIGPEIGLDIDANPNSVMGIGAILTYILTQKRTFTKNEDKKETSDKKGEDNGTT